MSKAIILALGISFMLIGCGGSRVGGDGKDLFSAWALEEGGLSLDITGNDFGTFSFLYSLPGGELCAALMTVAGTQKKGTIGITFSTYVPGTGSGIDPACPLLNGANDYTKTSKKLTLCDDTGCLTFI